MSGMDRDVVRGRGVVLRELEAQVGCRVGYVERRECVAFTFGQLGIVFVRGGRVIVHVDSDVAITSANERQRAAGTFTRRGPQAHA